MVKKDVDLISLNTAPPLIAQAALRGKPIVIKDHALYLNYMLETSGEAEDFSFFLQGLWQWREKIKAERLTHDPLNTIQKTSIIKRMDFIEIELNDLGRYKTLDFNTYAGD